MYIPFNDLPCASYNGDLESYVDDTKTLLSFPLTEVDTGIKNLEEDLHKIASWCCENNLLVNPDKTKFMIIGTRQLINELDVNISISFMGKILEPIIVLFVETPRKFITAKLSIRKPGSSSVLII